MKRLTFNPYYYIIIMNFDYLHIQQSMESIEIPDTGNVYLQVNNDDKLEWYLGIETKLGWTRIQEYGPLTIDTTDIGYSFSYKHYKFEYNAKKLYSIINKFLNDEKRTITQAKEIEKEDFDNRLKGLTYETN